MSSLFLVTTTCSEAETLRKIGDWLVENRLAACVQLSGPITSTYWWKGNVQSDEEWLLSIKTRSDLWPLVAEAIRSRHPYQVPEIIAVNIAEASEPYRDWLQDQLVKGP